MKVHPIGSETYVDLTKDEYEVLSVFKRWEYNLFGLNQIPIYALRKTTLDWFELHFGKTTKNYWEVGNSWWRIENGAYAYKRAVIFKRAVDAKYFTLEFNQGLTRCAKCRSLHHPTFRPMRDGLCRNCHHECFDVELPVQITKPIETTKQKAWKKLTKMVEEVDKT